MRKMLLMLSALALLAGAVAGCGPKLNEKEKNTPPPASAKNPRGYVAPPEGATRGQAPRGAPGT